MQKKSLNKIFYYLRYTGLFLLLTAGYNNCSPAFKSNSIEILSSSSNSTGATCDAREQVLLQAFQSTFYVKARSSCVSCHGSFQSPKFATTDVASSLAAATSYFDSNNVEGSTLYVRARNGHCGESCQAGSTQSNAVVASLESWSAAVASAPNCSEPPPPDVMTGPPPPPIVTPPVVVAPTPIPPVIQLPPVAGLSSKGSVGIQNFSEIAAAMAAVTGIPLNTSSVQFYYDDSLTRMSTDGVADGVTNAMLLTYTTMASTFCRELTMKEVALKADEREFYPNIDFTKNMASITDAQLNEVIGEYADRFWGREPTAAELTIYKNLSVELAGPLSGLSAFEQTKALMLLTCTSALSSLDSIIN